MQYFIYQAPLLKGANHSGGPSIPICFLKALTNPFSYSKITVKSVQQPFGLTDKLT